MNDFYLYTAFVSNEMFYLKNMRCQSIYGQCAAAGCELSPAVAYIRRQSILMKNSYNVGSKQVKLVNWFLTYFISCQFILKVITAPSFIIARNIYIFKTYLDINVLTAWINNVKTF